MPPSAPQRRPCRPHLSYTRRKPGGRSALGGGPVLPRHPNICPASPRVGARITRVRFSTKSNYLSHFLSHLTLLLTYTHHSLNPPPTHSLTHSLTHSNPHPPTNSLNIPPTHPPTHLVRANLVRRSARPRPLVQCASAMALPGKGAAGCTWPWSFTPPLRQPVRRAHHRRMRCRHQSAIGHAAEKVSEALWALHQRHFRRRRAGAGEGAGVGSLPVLYLGAGAADMSTGGPGKVRAPNPTMSAKARTLPGNELRAALICPTAKQRASVNTQQRGGSTP
jgi:hypothetical protein